MGRLLRDRKIFAVDAKRTRAQSHLSNSNAKTPRLRHALVDKTNSSGNVSLGNDILPVAVTTTRSRAKSFVTSCSENDSPNSKCLGKKAKASRTRDDKLNFIENNSCTNTNLAKNRARNPLGEITNSSESESPINNSVSGRKGKKEEDKKFINNDNVLESDSSAKKPMAMALRGRKNQKLSAENSLSQTRLPNKIKSLNHKRLCLPQALPRSKNQTIACLDLSSKKLSNSFVQLEDISELVRIHNENKSAKKPIYQTMCEENNKTHTEILPEDKIKLYEYEVDANSPKIVRVKRKRKPRKKKVVISDSDLSNDEGNCLVHSVVKRQCTVSSSSTLKSKANEAASSKTNSVNPIDTHVLSPIKNADMPVESTLRNVKFTAQLPSANSTPIAAETVKESVPVKALRFSHKEIRSPVSKIIPRRQIKKSIYVNPATILELHSSPDHSIASEVNTTENDTDNLINSPSHSLKQTKINSFFSTSARSGNDTGKVANLNNSGLFDELPSRSISERMSTTAASTASQFITMRRKALYHARPRISGFEQTPTSQKPLPPMTIENCFGFDDANDAEPNFIPPSNQYRSLPLSLNFRAVSSTPITAPQPTRICIQTVIQPVPKKIVKLATSPKRGLKRPMPLAAQDPSAASTSEYTSHSPPLILSDPETLMPVTFGDEPSNFFKPARRSYQRTPKPKHNYAEAMNDDDDEPLVVAKKAKKKGKQYSRKKKQEEDNWVSSINRQFEEIEDVDLVVE